MKTIPKTLINHLIELQYLKTNLETRKQMFVSLSCKQNPISLLLSLPKMFIHVIPNWPFRKFSLKSKKKRQSNRKNTVCIKKTELKRDGFSYLFKL